MTLSAAASSSLTLRRLRAAVLRKRLLEPEPKEDGGRSCVDSVARSAILTDWPGGGYIGIHGTDQPDLIQGRVSHRCIRLRNADIVRLAALMPLGTPVTIR
jgi:lipoprotein-anchoring transpeptidase ErfK/SrfK